MFVEIMKDMRPWDKKELFQEKDIRLVVLHIDFLLTRLHSLTK